MISFLIFCLGLFLGTALGMAFGDLIEKLLRIR